MTDLCPADYDLYDSNTANKVTAKELYLTDTEYRALVRDSLLSGTHEGHVRTCYGRKVYAQL